MGRKGKHLSSLKRYHNKYNLLMNDTYNDTHILDITRALHKVVADTPSYVIKARLGTPNIHKVCIYGTTPPQHRQGAYMSVMKKTNI
jgi:hypothetical protein